MVEEGGREGKDGGRGGREGKDGGGVCEDFCYSRVLYIDSLL